MNKLIWLPNTEGFKFVGITHEGEEIDCTVKRISCGTHQVVDCEGKLVFHKLKGWRSKWGTDSKKG